MVTDNGSKVILDPTCNLWFEHSIDKLISDPKNADTVRDEDQRYKERNYGQYSTSFWYERVTQYRIKKSPKDKAQFRTARQMIPIKRL